MKATIAKGARQPAHVTALEKPITARFHPADDGDLVEIRLTPWVTRKLRALERGAGVGIRDAILGAVGDGVSRWPK